MDILASILWLCSLTVILIALKREVQKAVFGLGFRLTARWPDDERRKRVAVIFHYVLMWPGILVHEFSHWLVAFLLGARPTAPQVQLKMKRASVELGSVSTRKVDAVRSSLIGAAPLLGGTLVVLLLGNLAFGISLGPGRSAIEGLAAVLANFDRYVQAPDALVWVYLIFAVSNSMLPSPSDRQEWREILLFLGAGSVVVILLTGLPPLPANVFGFLHQAIESLAFGFGLTILVDLVVLAFLLILDALIAFVQPEPGR